MKIYLLKQLNKSYHLQFGTILEFQQQPCIFRRGIESIGDVVDSNDIPINEIELKINSTFPMLILWK